MYLKQGHNLSLHLSVCFIWDHKRKNYIEKEEIILSHLMWLCYSKIGTRRFPGSYHKTSTKVREISWVTPCCWIPYPSKIENTETATATSLTNLWPLAVPTDLGNTELSIPTFRTISDFLTGPDSKLLLSGVQEGIDRTNRRAAANPQKVQIFTILSKEFSMATGELGPTTKLKRFHIYKKFSKEIEKMYQ